MDKKSLAGLAVNMLLQVLEDATLAKKMQPAMLKVFKTIARVYKSQQDFHDAAEKELNS